MKYYTISFPGEFNQHVVETWSEQQILASYFPYWSEKMSAVGKDDMISEELCISDWVVVHWACETDQWGNKL